MNKVLAWIIIIIVIGAAIWLFTSGILKAPESETEVIPLTFINHLQAGFPEQDVFVQMAENTEQVFRVDVDMATSSEVLAKAAWSTRDETEHDPFKTGDEPLGPFRRGAELGFTMGEWLDAEGTGTYTVSDRGARIEFTAENLVPSATYTVWCSVITLEPMSVVDMPCGAEDGSENTLMSDANGSARFDLALDEPLPESTENEITVIALAYHSDGKTYEADPGEFGKATHVHIFSMLPPPGADNGGVEGETTTTEELDTNPESKQ